MTPFHDHVRRHVHSAIHSFLILPHVYIPYYRTQIYVYIIKDASVDTGITATKGFLTADEVLNLINGASDVLNSKFSLTTVAPSVAEPRTGVDPSTSVCVDQNVGIGIAAALGAVIVILVITIIGCYIYRKRNDKDTDE